MDSKCSLKWNDGLSVAIPAEENKNLCDDEKFYHVYGRDDNVGKQMLKCKYCSKLFRTSSTRYNHMCSEHFGWRWRCTLCTKVYSSKSAASIHILKTHLEHNYNDYVVSVRYESLATASWTKYAKKNRKSNLKSRFLSKKINCDDDHPVEQPSEEFQTQCCSCCFAMFANLESLEEHLAHSSICLSSAYVLIAPLSFDSCTVDLSKTDNSDDQHELNDKEKNLVDRLVQNICTEEKSTTESTLPCIVSTFSMKDDKKEEIPFTFLPRIDVETLSDNSGAYFFKRNIDIV